MENNVVIVVCASGIRAQIKAECLTQTNRFRLMDITSWLLKHEQKSWGWTLRFLKSTPVYLQTYLFITKGSDHIGLSTKLFTFSPYHLYLSPYHLYLLAKSCVMAKKLPTEPVSFSFRPNLMSWQCFLLLIFGHKNNPLMFRSCPYTMTSKECLVSLKSKLSSYNYGCNLPFKYVFCLCWCCSNFYQNKFNIRL